MHRSQYQDRTNYTGNRINSDRTREYSSNGYWGRDYVDSQRDYRSNQSNSYHQRQFLTNNGASGKQIPPSLAHCRSQNKSASSAQQVCDSSTDSSRKQGQFKTTQPESGQSAQKDIRHTINQRRSSYADDKKTNSTNKVENVLCVVKSDNVSGENSQQQNDNHSNKKTSIKNKVDDQKKVNNDLREILFNPTMKGISTCQQGSAFTETIPSYKKTVSNITCSRVQSLSLLETSKNTSITSKQATPAKNSCEAFKSSIKISSDQNKKQKPQEVSLSSIKSPVISNVISLQVNQPSTSQEEPTSNIHLTEPASISNALTSSSVLEALSCQECKEWTSSSDLYLCNCRLLCQTCQSKQKQDICKFCQTSFQSQSRLSSFHARIASNISHPCRYKSCNTTVKPGDQHEESCQYVPVSCFKCAKSIPKVLLRKHYDDEHPKQVLTDKNVDVKFSDFVKIENGGDQREIYCFTHGLMIPITLNSLNNQHDFIITAPHFNEAPCNITVKFEFKFQSYSFKEEKKITNDLEQGLDMIRLPHDVFNDWLIGKCKLEIVFNVRQKRKAPENRSRSKKKKKAVADEEDGTNFGESFYDGLDLWT